MIWSHTMAQKIVWIVIMENWRKKNDSTIYLCWEKLHPAKMKTVFNYSFCTLFVCKWTNKSVKANSPSCSQLCYFRGAAPAHCDLVTQEGCVKCSVGTIGSTCGQYGITSWSKCSWYPGGRNTSFLSNSVIQIEIVFLGKHVMVSEPSSPQP